MTSADIWARGGGGRFAGVCVGVGAVGVIPVHRLLMRIVGIIQDDSI